MGGPGVLWRKGFSTCCAPLKFEIPSLEHTFPTVSGPLLFLGPGI